MKKLLLALSLFTSVYLFAMQKEIQTPGPGKKELSQLEQIDKVLRNQYIAPEDYLLALNSYHSNTVNSNHSVKKSLHDLYAYQFSLSNGYSNEAPFTANFFATYLKKPYAFVNEIVSDKAFQFHFNGSEFFLMQRHPALSNYASIVPSPGSPVEFTGVGEPHFFTELTNQSNFHLPNSELEKFSTAILDRDSGYLKLYRLKKDSIRDIQKILDDFWSRGMSSLVLDLRKMSSSDPEALASFLELFLRKGQLFFSLEDKNGLRTFNSQNDSPYKFYNILVLLDDHSSFEAHILASLLKNNRSATLIGQSSKPDALVYLPVKISSGKLYLPLHQYKGKNASQVSKGLRMDLSRELVGLSDPKALYEEAIK